jgi:trimeric autotransporter adhesin
VVANWNFGTNPGDQANLHWTGTAWEPCGLNFEFAVTLRDANGNNSSNYCNNYSTNASSRTGFDISGQSMAAVYDQIRSGGFTNISIANAPAALGAQTFPADSILFYLTNTRLTSAIAYNPGSNSLVNKFPQSTGTAAACSAPNPATQVSTLEELVANFPGTPCVFNSAETITNVNGSFTSANPRTLWGSTTLGITTLGTAPLLATPSSYYTTNTLVRLAFTAGAPNEVTYYLCKQRETNGSTRECVAKPTKGVYAIHTLPDSSRYMSFTNLPPETSALTFNKAFVERNGVVLHAYKDKLNVTSSARFNTPASNALLAKLGMAAIDPEVPLALTAASYQGTWDFRDAGTPFATNVGSRVTISGNNTFSCIDNTTGNAFTCTGAVTNPLTGAFSISFNSSATGTFDFIAGTAIGTNSNTSGTPPSAGPIVGMRR